MSEEDGDENRQERDDNDGAEVQQMQMVDKMALANASSKRERERGFLSMFQSQFGRVEANDIANVENTEIEMIGYPVFQKACLVSLYLLILFFSRDFSSHFIFSCSASSSSRLHYTYRKLGWTRGI